MILPAAWAARLSYDNITDGSCMKRVRVQTIQADVRSKLYSEGCSLQH